MLRISVVILCFFFIFCCVYALPHCERTEIPKRLVVSNVINVIYTMESSCKICVQQASRLPRLKRYLEKKGIKTHFIIGVSHRAERLSGLVPHIQVNSRHVWRSLGEQNNHFYIVDRCGRLVYEVINPWSNLNLSFVKAAVATTAHSHPCGLCPADYTHIPKEEEIQEFPSLDSYSPSLPKDISSLTMNIRLRHKHRGDPSIYNYIVKVAGLPDYHGHLPDDRETPSYSVSTVDITTQEPEVTVPEKSSSFTRDTTKYESNEFSTTSESIFSHLAKSSTSNSISNPTEFLSSKHNNNEPTEPSTLKNSVNNPTEPPTLKYSVSRPIESSTIVSESHSTEPTVSINSIKTLRKEEQQMADGHNDKKTPITTISIETSHTETITENISNGNKEETHYNDYGDDYKKSEKTDKELTSEEEAELENLKVHYRRILDWMDFFSDENYDD